MPDSSLPRLPLLVLAGGFSRRMGRDKAGLLWRGTPLLLHVIRRLSPIASQTWVAARPGQDLPRGDYRRVDDRRPGDGPLAGLAAGLPAIDSTPTPVAVAACDYPFADPALFSALRAIGPDAPAVVPVFRGQAHPLMGVWRSDTAAVCEEALAQGVRRVRDVLDRIGAIEVAAADIDGFDAERALLNVNDREAWERELRQSP